MAQKINPASCSTWAHSKSSIGTALQGEGDARFDVNIVAISINLSLMEVSLFQARVLISNSVN